MDEDNIEKKLDIGVFGQDNYLSGLNEVVCPNGNHKEGVDLKYIININGHELKTYSCSKCWHTYLRLETGDHIIE